MSKSSVKNHQNQSSNNLVQQQQQPNNNNNHHHNKSNAERLKKKLKLQEMRCNLMSTEMAKLKNILSAKKRQLRLCEKRAKREEKKRRDEEKKLKDIEKEFARIKKEVDDMKENGSLNQTNQSTQQQSVEEASTSNSTINISSSSVTSSTSTPSLSSSVGPGKNKKNKKQKFKVETSPTTGPPSPILMETVIESCNTNNKNVNSKKEENSTNLQPSSSKNFKINEGASCSGVNTNGNVATNSLHEHELPNNRLEDLFENELMCSICHELFIKPVALPCLHIFCTFCIEQWRKKAHKCPICRKTFLQIAPQNILENVIEKVVSTMDDESQKRRSDVIKDRPVSTDAGRFSRSDGRRLLIPELSAWGGIDTHSDSISDSSSYQLPNYPTSFPSFIFGGRSSESESIDSDISSDIPPDDRFFDAVLSRYNENDYLSPFDIRDDEDEDEDDDDEDIDDEDIDDVDEDEDDESHSETYDLDNQSDSSVEALNNYSPYDDDDWYSSEPPSPIVIGSESSDYSGGSTVGSSFMDDGRVDGDQDLDDSGSDTSSESDTSSASSSHGSTSWHSIEMMDSDISDVYDY